MPPRLIMVVRRGDLSPFQGECAALPLLYSGGRSLVPASGAWDCIAEYSDAAIIQAVSSGRFPPDKKFLLLILANLQEKICFRILF